MNPKNDKQVRLKIDIDLSSIAWAGFWIGAGIVIGAEMIAKAL